MNRKYHFHEVQITPHPTEITSRSEVNLEVKYVTKHSKRLISGVPVCVANLDTTGTLAMAKAASSEDLFCALHKHIKLDEKLDKFLEFYQRHIFLSVGMGENEWDRFRHIYIRTENLNRQKPDFCLMLDVANGYMYSFLDTIKRYREGFPNMTICAGNVCTPEGVENIIKAGADIVKCGIASGGVCDTKNKAGVGCPQFSVAQECGQAANELEALCMSDGGVRTPADICKALAAGSHFVMAGSLFAGYDECEGEWEYELNYEKGLLSKNPWSDKKKRLRFYGMSSKAANDKYNGGLKEYRASEGKEIWVDYKGPVSNLLQDIKGSLASCCSYCNTSHLENLKKNAKFVLV